jgi:hypothetical protein
VTDQELDKGFTHEDHMGTETDRINIVSHLDSPWRGGEANGWDVYYDRKSRRTSAVYLWWLVPFGLVVVFVIAVIGSIR